MNRAQVLTRMQPVFDGIFLEPVPLREEIQKGDMEEWDSLVHVSLMVGIERTFGVRFDVGETERVKTVGDLADLVLVRVSRIS